MPRLLSEWVLAEVQDGTITHDCENQKNVQNNHLRLGSKEYAKICKNQLGSQKYARLTEHTEGETS